MSLSIGQTLDHYEILEPIGKGGMGEVYRATDRKLGRDVAIKVLPEALTRDPERLARFEREAKLLAALNHPNIAAIHGLEEADGKPFLVLEFVEGEDLAERLKRGPIPLEEAIAIAGQIVEALEAAHEKGIVHRDLKPANVKVTPDGRVKVLDFGLAKVYLDEGLSASGASAALSQSPTLAQNATGAGVIMGTAAYMSPEQARGKPVDKRADIWAFGVVLFEMLTGRTLFSGETVSDVLAAVLTREPDWDELDPATPRSTRRLLRRALRRDPRERLRDIGDARVELVETDLDDAEPESTSNDSGLISWRVTAAVALLAAAVGAAAGRLVDEPERVSEETSRDRQVRFEIPLPEGTYLTDGLALSPDGGTLAFAAQEHETLTSIYVRSLDTLETRRLDGTEGARFPFWSRDGRQLGYFAGGALQIRDLVGQTSRRIAPTGGFPNVRGGSWGADDTIVYAPMYFGGLLKADATQSEDESKGALELATRLDEAENEGTHRLPVFLPDGRRFLFFAAPATGTEPGTIRMGELGSAESRKITESSSIAVFVAPDTIVYTRGRALVAQRIDVDKGELLAEPIPLGPELPGNFVYSGVRALAAAAGTLAYQMGVEPTNRLVWVSRDGAEEEVVFEGHGWLTAPRLSPDGERIAVSVYEGASPRGTMWVLDPRRNNTQRLSFAGRDDAMAVWSSDGEELLVYGVETGSTDAGIYRMDARRPRSETLVKLVPGLAYVDAVIPNGDAVIVSRLDQSSRFDIWRVPLDGAEEPTPILATPSFEGSSDVSPDGEWLAYSSDESGRDEVYVRRLDGGDEVWKVSADGGTSPVWRRDGRELFFVDTRYRLLTAPTSLGDTFSSGTPEVLFFAGLDDSGDRNYDVSPDGQRFLINRRTPGSPNPIVVVLGLEGWLASRMQVPERAGR